MSCEIGDKVVVKIDKDAAGYLNDELDMFPAYAQVLGKLEDFQPKQEKIEFTPEMKKEFDELYKKLFLNYSSNAYKTMCTLVESDNFPELNAKVAGSFDKQMNLLNCLRNPSLIEVIEPKPELEKHSIPLGLRTTDGYMQFLSCPKNSGEHRSYFASRKDMKLIQKFSLDEVKNIKNAFPNIDLTGIWNSQKALVQVQVQVHDLNI